MPYLLLHFISCALAYAIYYWAMAAFLREKKPSLWVRIAVVVFSAAFLQMVNRLHSPWLNTIAGILLALFMALVFFEGRVSARLLVAVGIPVVQVACEFLSVGVYSALQKATLASTTARSVMALGFSYVSLSVFYASMLAVRFFVLRKKKKLNGPHYSPSPSLIALPLLSVFLLYYLLLASAKLPAGDRLQNMSIAVMLGILIVNVLLLVADNKTYKAHLKDSEYLAMQLGAQLHEQLIVQQANSIDELECMAHDYSKQLGAVQQLVLERYGPDEVLQQYFAAIGAGQASYTPRYSFDNRALCAILNYHAGRCAAAGIEFKVEVRYSALDFIAFPDLCTLLANALENAFEAASEIPVVNGGQARFIRFLVVRHNHMLLFDVENSMLPGAICFENGCYLSTKPREAMPHGIGLKNIQRIVDLYNGDLILSHKVDVFRLKAMIPMPDGELGKIS